MANELNIGVRFGAEGIPQVIKSATQFNQQLERMQTSISSTANTLQSELSPSLQRTTQHIERFKAGLKIDPTGQASILNVAENLENVETSARAAAAGVKAFSSAASAGSGLVTDFSRVIQDLPFGFLGVANNLTQLPGSLQRFSAAAKESGKSVGALLLSSVSGFSGIGLALSLVTSGLLIAQNGIAGFGRASKKAKEDADELAKTIRSIGEIQAEGIGGVQGQIAQVGALAAAVSDSNKPYAERKRALEELKGINKSYFGDLQLEDAATGKLTKTVEEYNKALIAQALVKSFANEIAEVAKAAIKADTELEKLDDRLSRAQNDLNAAKANSRPQGISATAETQAEADANKELINAFNEQRAQREKVLQLQTQQILLTNELNKAQTEALKFKSLETTKTGKEEVDLLKKRLQQLEKIKETTRDIFTITGLEEQIFDLKVKITLRDAAKNGLTKEEVDLAIQGFKNQLSEAFEKEALALEAIPKVKVTNVEMVPLDTSQIESKVAKATGLDKDISISTERAIRIKFLGLEFVEAEERAKEAMQKLRDVLLNAAITGFADVGNLLGEAFGNIISGSGVGSVLAKAAQGFLAIIGGVLQDIGKQIIATSLAVQALKKALASLFLNPALALAVGIGLVALGGLLKNIKFDVPAFASGVTNFSGGLALVGERGPELVNLPRGSDVIPNHLLGEGNLNVVVHVEGVVSGDNIRIVGQRTEQKRSRI